MSIIALNHFSRSSCILAALVLAGILGVAHAFMHAPINQPDGILIEVDPVQKPLPAGQVQFEKEGFLLSAQATYDIKARVLSSSRYRFDDGAALAPIDLALGWKAMSDSAVLRQLDISQSRRFYYWKPRAAAAGLSAGFITPNSANSHLIPANDYVKSDLESLRVGQLVELKGYLVNASRPDGYHWNTSLSRMDSGAGACELIYVDSVIRL